MGTKRLIAMMIGAAATIGLAAGVAHGAATAATGAGGSLPGAVTMLQTETTSTPAHHAATEGGERWHFTIPLGVWPFGIQGPVGVSGYETDVDMSISDVQNLQDRALGFAFEAGRGKVTALAGAYFLRFEPDAAWATLPNNVAVYGNPRLEWFTAELAGAYQSAVIDPGPRMFVFEPLVGVRYTKLQSSIHLEQPADTSLAKRDVDWTDAFVGFRAMKSFTDHIGLSFRGDIGAGGSKLTWNAAGAVGYRFPFEKSALTFAVGYKANGIDFESDKANQFFLDQTMVGPTFGVAYSF